MLKIMLGIPAYRSQVHVGHLMQLAALVKAVTAYGVNCARCSKPSLHGAKFCTNCGQPMPKEQGRPARLGIEFADTTSIDWARNYLVHSALKADFDWLLMIDADTFFANAQVEAMPILRMLVEAEKRRAAVIAAPVRLRNRDGYNVARVVDGKEVFLGSDDFRGHLLEVDLIGTAFMAVKLGWIATCWPAGPWFEHKQFQDPGAMPRWLGEDWRFCDGVRDRGGSVLCDGRFEPVHAGTTADLATWGELCGVEAVTNFEEQRIRAHG